MRIILGLIFLLSAAISGSFYNDIPIKEIQQDIFPKATIYCDTNGHQYIECKLAVIPGGYTGEAGTPLEGKYLVDLSGLDQETIDYITSIRNYERAEKQYKNKK